jgi:hypothetical protein
MYFKLGDFNSNNNKGSCVQNWYFLSSCNCQKKVCTALELFVISYSRKK